jgi:hypothetical protein
MLIKFAILCVTFFPGIVGITFAFKCYSLSLDCLAKQSAAAKKVAREKFGTLKDGVHAQYASRKKFFFSKLADLWYSGG